MLLSHSVKNLKRKPLISSSSVYMQIKGVFFKLGNISKAQTHIHIYSSLNKENNNFQNKHIFPPEKSRTISGLTVKITKIDKPFLNSFSEIKIMEDVITHFSLLQRKILFHSMHALLSLLSANGGSDCTNLNTSGLYFDYMSVSTLPILPRFCGKKFRKKIRIKFWYCRI